MFFCKFWFFNSTISTFWLLINLPFFFLKIFDFKFSVFSLHFTHNSPFSFITSVSKKLRINFYFTFWIIFVMNKSSFNLANSSLWFFSDFTFSNQDYSFGKRVTCVFFTVLTINMHVLVICENYIFFYWVRILLQKLIF